MSKETQQKDILKKGYTLKDYRIISVLGRGAFGITYKAYDEKNSKTVAIKEFFYSNFVVRENNSTVIPISTAKSKQEEYEEFLQKFQNEAKIVSKLNHINIVKVSDFFRANNTAYFVMSYEEGETLGKRLEKIHKFEDEESILEIIIPVLEGLKVVHQNGFLHRDLKPDNIYLRDGGLPMLLDFGAARFAIGKETKSLTAIATPGYAPPEQYSEYSKQTSATDLYAIGAILYKMITGVKPPDANHRQTERLNDNPDPIEKLTTVYSGKYSQDFLKAVDASLELKPKDRPQSIEEFQKILLFSYYNAGADEPLEDDKKTDDSFEFIKKYWYLWTIVGLLIFIGVFTNYKKTTLFKESKTVNRQSISSSPPIIDVKIEKPTKIESTPVEEDKSLQETFTPTLYSLHIKSVPHDASVQIMNIQERYYDGIELKNGAYRVVVSKSGYIEQEKIVTINGSDRVVRFFLEKKILLHTLHVKATPSNSTIKIMNIEDKYYDGIKLKSGEYKIEVSKSGYQTKTKTIHISSGDKTVRFSLDKIVQNRKIENVDHTKSSTRTREQEICKVAESKIAVMSSELNRLKRKYYGLNSELKSILDSEKVILNRAKETYSYDNNLYRYNRAVRKYNDILRKYNETVTINKQIVNEEVAKYNRANRRYKRMNCNWY